MSDIFNSIQVSDEVNRFVDHSFDVVNKIHYILEKQGKTQRDLAVLLGKSESEISKWMRGTHNFTLKSLAKIESVLGQKLVEVLKDDEVIVKKQVSVLYSNFIKQHDTVFKKTDFINKPSSINMPSELKETFIEQSKLNQIIEDIIEESNYAMAA